VYVHIARTEWICLKIISLATELFYNNAMYDESSLFSKLTAVFCVIAPHLNIESLIILLFLSCIIFVDGEMEFPCLTHTVVSIYAICFKIIN